MRLVNDAAGGAPVLRMRVARHFRGRRLPTYELTELTNTGLIRRPRVTEAGMEMFAYAAELAARKRCEAATISQHPWCMPKSMASTHDMDSNYFSM